MNIPAVYRNPRVRRSFKRMLIFIAIALLGWLLFVWFVQRLLLFPTWVIQPAQSVTAPEGAQVIWIEPNGKDAGLKVEAWLLMGNGVSAENPGPLVFYAHGNAELIDYWADEMQMYVQQGVSVLLVEYRGYGRSGGSPSQQSIVSDYTKFYDQMTKRPEIDPARIIYHGRSLGGGILGALAADRPPAALILESTFTNVAPLARRFTLPGFLVRDPMNTRNTLASYQGPVLIMHGNLDEVIPVSHAHANHKASPQSQLIIEPNMTHNNRPPDIEIYWRNIFTFLREAGVLGAK